MPFTPLIVAAVVVASVAISVATTYLLAPKAPKIAAARRNLTSKAAIGEHKLIFGQTRAAGVLTWEEKTSDGKYYQVITLAPHPVAEIGAILFDDVVVITDGAGNAVAPGTLADGTTPKSYAGVARIIRANGTVSGDAAMHAFLAANCKTWTDDCRQDGRAKIAIQWTYNEAVLANGLPNVTAILKGALALDPRADAIAISSASGWLFTTASPHGLTAGSYVFIRGHVGGSPAVSGAYEVYSAPSTTTFYLFDYSQDIQFASHGSGGTATKMIWTDNPVCVGVTYLCDKNHGIAATYADEFDNAQSISAADSCDEYVSRASPAATFTADASTDKVTYALGQALGNLPDYAQVTVSNSGGALPGGLAANTIYYFKRSGGDAIGYLCTSLANAQATPPVKIDITSAGTGTHTITLVVTFTANLATGNSDANSISLFSNSLRILTGTKVRVASTTTLPSGLSAGTDYYAIFQTDRRIRLASSLANARAGTAITLSSAGTGTHTITVQSELRYTCNGIVSTSETPKTIADRIAECMAGDFVPSGVTFGFYPGVWRTPAISVDESHLRGGIQLETLQSAQDSFNSVKGIYFDPFGNFQPADFPAYKSATYIADDNGETVWKDFKYELINSSTQAQRVSHIALERIRRERTITMQLKYSAFQIQVCDVINVTNALWSMSNQTYEVRSWAFSIGEDENGIPALNVDIVARQLDANVFAWATANETGAKRPGVVTTIPDALGAPMDVTANVASGSVTVKWSTIGSAKVKGYRVVASPQGGNISSGSVLDALRSTTEMTTPLANGNYTIHVNGVDLQGNHGPAGTANVSIASGGTFSPYTRTYDTGSGSEAIPTGAGNVTVKGWGGGGGSGPGQGAGTKGGGGGGYFERTIALVSSDAGKVFDWSVGEGGASGYYDPAEVSPYIAGDAGGATTAATPVALNAGSFSMTANGGAAAPANSTSTAAGGTASGGSTNTTGQTSTTDGGSNSASGSGAGGIFNSSNGSTPCGGGGGTTTGVSFSGGSGRVQFSFTA